MEIFNWVCELKSNCIDIFPLEMRKFRRELRLLLRMDRCMTIIGLCMCVDLRTRRLEVKLSSEVFAN